jgi:hypothetical protein
LQQLFFTENPDDTTQRAPLGFLTSALRTIANTSVGLVTLILAATLGKRLLLIKWPCGGTKPSAHSDKSTDQEPESLTVVEPVSLDVMAMPTAMPEDVSNPLPGSTQSMATPSETDASTVIDQPKPEADGSRALRSSDFGPGFVAALVINRVLLLGALQFGLVYAFGERVFPTSEDSKLIQLMLYVQSIIPSSSIGVVACQGLGLQNVAELMAMAIFFQQILITIVIMFSNTVALSTVYG